MPSNRKLYCTRCKHERGKHGEDGGWDCKANRKNGQLCKCPKFADPNRMITPPADYRPRGEKK